VGVGGREEGGGGGGAVMGEQTHACERSQTQRRQVYIYCVCMLSAAQWHSTVSVCTITTV